MWTSAMVFIQGSWSGARRKCRVGPQSALLVAQNWFKENIYRTPIDLGVKAKGFLFMFPQTSSLIVAFESQAAWRRSER